MTGDWVLLIVRPVSVPGVGVLDAVAEVPLPLISVLFSAVGEIPGLRIALERRDGELLVSQPYDEMRIGKPQRATISSIQANGVAFMVPTSLIKRPTIGVARASLYPDVMIALTLDLRTATEDWVRDRNRMILVVTIALLLLGALALTLTAAQRQRERADAERSRARTVLDSAIESMSDGFVMWDEDDRLVLCNQQFRQMYQDQLGVYSARRPVRRHHPWRRQIGTISGGRRRRRGVRPGDGCMASAEPWPDGTRTAKCALGADH